MVYFQLKPFISTEKIKNCWVGHDFDVLTSLNHEPLKTLPPHQDFVAQPKPQGINPFTLYDIVDTIFLCAPCNSVKVIKCHDICGCDSVQPTPYSEALVLGFISIDTKLMRA